MRERRARLSLITVAALAVVVPGAAAGLDLGVRPEVGPLLRERGGPGWLVQRATLATGDRVHSRMPTVLPARQAECLSEAPGLSGEQVAPVEPVAAPGHASQRGDQGHLVRQPDRRLHRRRSSARCGRRPNGGNTWTRIMNLGYPYYWYGVDALSENDVVISGFDNSNWRGLLRWSHDGGQTWGSDVVLTTRGWSMRVRFADAQHGLVLDLINLDGPSVAHYTTNGGQTAADWTTVVLDPNGGWFGNQFSFLTDLKAWASGITYCASPDGGASWNCRESVDEVFDGPTFFHDDQSGWVGGGSISPTVEGWVHRTADGGADVVGPDPAGALADPRDPLRDEQPRLGSRRQHLLGRRRPLLLERRRTDVEPRPRLRGSRAGRVRPLEPRPRPPEPSGVVRRLRQHVRGQGVHPQALGVERLRGTTFRSRLELLAASSTSSTSTASTGSTGGGVPSRRLAATAS